MTRRDPNRLPARYVRNRDHARVADLYVRFAVSYDDLLRALEHVAYQHQLTTETTPAARVMALLREQLHAQGATAFCHLFSDDPTPEQRAHQDWATRHAPLIWDGPIPS